MQTDKAIGLENQTDAFRHVIHNETYKQITDSVFSDISALEKAGQSNKSNYKISKNPH